MNSNNESKPFPEHGRFTRIPITVEAVRITPQRLEDMQMWPYWLITAFHNKQVIVENGHIYIKTSEGWLRVGVWDWVIHFNNGALTACVDSVFRELYRHDEHI